MTRLNNATLKIKPGTGYQVDETVTFPLPQNCPCCGGKPIIRFNPASTRREIRIICTARKCGLMTPWYRTYVALIRMWNRRTPSSAPRLVLTAVSDGAVTKIGKAA